MEKYIIEDEYGFWHVVESSSPDAAVKLFGNLPSIGKTRCVGLDEEISFRTFLKHNCASNMRLNDCRCTCGQHK